MEGPWLDQLARENSICDIIMKTDEKQTMEVVEHLLHAITDVGLHHSQAGTWSVSTDSGIKDLMDQAVANKTYDVSSYKAMPDGIRRRVEIQEYAYWLITTGWDIQTAYGPEVSSEWPVNTREGLASSHPDAMVFFDQAVTKVLTPPTAEVLSSFQ